MTGGTQLELIVFYIGGQKHSASMSAPFAGTGAGSSRNSGSDGNEDDTGSERTSEVRQVT